MELGVPSYLINATLLGVLAQRLVRTLCSNCKVKDESASREALAEMVKPWQVNGGYRPYKPVGCVECRMTGFRGRMGLYELLSVTEATKTKSPKSPTWRHCAVRLSATVCVRCDWPVPSRWPKV